MMEEQKDPQMRKVELYLKKQKLTYMLSEIKKLREEIAELEIKED